MTPEELEAQSRPVDLLDLLDDPDMSEEEKEQLLRVLDINTDGPKTLQ